MQPTRHAAITDSIGTPQPTDWRRSSAVSILRNLKHSIGVVCKSYMEIGGLSALAFSFTKSLSFTAAIVLGSASALVILSAILSSWFLRFKISQGHIEIISGVFKRKHLVIPFERVQQLSTEQPLYYRWFGDFVDVKIDTAGSDDTEAVLPAIRQHEYAQLQQRIGCKSERALDGHHHSAADDLNELPHQDDIVFKQNAWSLLLYGIFQNKLLWFIAIIIGFFEKLTDAITSIKERLPDQSAAIDSMTAIDTTPVAGVAVFLVVIGIVTFMLFSALYSFAEHYGFTLSRTSDGYLTTQGWLKKVMHRASKRKIQNVVIQRNIAESWFGRQNIIIEQFGASCLTLPCVDSVQMTHLLSELCLGHQLSSVALCRGSFIFVVKNWLLFSLPLCVLAYAFANAEPMNDDIMVLAYFTLCVSLGLGVFHFLRWYRRAYAHDGQYFYLRRGRLIEKTMVIDKHKLQAASISQNFLMKKFELCTVTLFFSTGRFSIPYLPKHVGIEFFNSGLVAVMRSDKEWI